jgi:hypothetical protein
MIFWDVAKYQGATSQLLLRFCHTFAQKQRYTSKDTTCPQICHNYLIFVELLLGISFAFSESRCQHDDPHRTIFPLHFSPERAG